MPTELRQLLHRVLQSISELKMADIPDVDLSTVGTTTFGDFEVEVVDYTADYFDTLREVFDFPMLKAFLSRSDFKCATPFISLHFSIYSSVNVDRLSMTVSCGDDRVVPCACTGWCSNGALHGNEHADIHCDAPSVAAVVIRVVYAD